MQRDVFADWGTPEHRSNGANLLSMSNLNKIRGSKGPPMCPRNSDFSALKTPSRSCAYDTEQTETENFSNGARMGADNDIRYHKSMSTLHHAQRTDPVGNYSKLDVEALPFLWS